MPTPPSAPAADASFELAARKGWCLGERAAIDACLQPAAAEASSAASPSGGGDCMRELLALQKCLRARTLAERAIRGGNMGST
jgi:hypothetical protein